MNVLFAVDSGGHEPAAAAAAAAAPAAADCNRKRQPQPVASATATATGSASAQASAVAIAIATATTTATAISNTNDSSMQIGNLGPGCTPPTEVPGRAKLTVSPGATGIDLPGATPSARRAGGFLMRISN